MIESSKAEGCLWKIYLYLLRCSGFIEKPGFSRGYDMKLEVKLEDKGEREGRGVGGNILNV